MNTQFDRVFISRYLRGTCSEEEKVAFQTFLSNADPSVDIDWMKDIWESPDIEAKNLLGVEDRIFNKLEKLIAQKQTQQVRSTKEKVVHIPGSSFWQLYPAARYASVILIVLVPLLVYGTLIFDEPAIEEIAYHKKVTHNGQHLAFRLEDGSEITLNSNSKLVYPGHFTDSSREVQLEGEGFFNIAKDTKRPFTVHSGNVSTTALGTSFNINNALDSSGTEVSLVTGSVNVSIATKDKGNKEIVLRPNEQLVYDNAADSHFTQTFDYLAVAGWKDGVLFFKEASLQEVIDRLETWYDANIELGGDKTKFTAKEWKYTGTYTKASLENVLRGIGHSKSFSYSFEDNKNVIIYMN